MLYPAEGRRELQQGKEIDVVTFYHAFGTPHAAAGTVFMILLIKWAASSHQTASHHTAEAGVYIIIVQSCLDM